MTWTSWGGEVAEGRGNYVREYLQPDLGEYRPVKYPVTMRLSGVRRCLGELDYSRLEQAFLGPKPEGSASTTVELPCPRVFWASDPSAKAAYRPSKVYFGANGIIRNARWSTWPNDGSPARGRGLFLFKYCKPNCAQGRSRFFKVSITLSEPISCDAVGAFIWRRLEFRYSGSTPSGARRSYKLRYTKDFCQV